MNDIEIFPRALITAARTFAKKPAVVGEVLCALVAADEQGVTPLRPESKLSEVQQYIVEACREEIAERTARRERVAERKRRQRSRAKYGAEHNTKGGK